MLASAGSGDDELRELASIELATLQERANALASEILENMIERDEADERNAVLEIRSGTGGSEAQVSCIETLCYVCFDATRRFE